MSDFDHMSDEDLQKIAGQPAAPQDDFAHLSDDDLAKIAGQPTDLASKATAGLKSIGRGAVTAFGKISEALPDMTAPIRSGIGAYQDTGSLGDAFTAAQANSMGDNKKPPGWGDILEKGGVPGRKDMPLNLPIQKNPWGATPAEKNYQTSPAELGGVALETATDPATYLGLGAEKAAVDLPMEAGAAMERMAANRGVKAATGHSIQSVRKFAKAPASGAIDIGRAQDNLLRAGHGLINADEAGPPVIGWMSKSADAGPAVEAKRQFYGDKIAEVGSTLDQNVPGGAVSGKNIAQRMLDYAAKIPETERGKGLQERILAEARNFEQKGNMPFSEAQKYKNDFKYKHGVSDALISDQDSTNAMNRMISDEMEAAVDAHKQTLNPETLSQYKDYKDRYGLYRTASEAINNEQLKSLSRNIASPSSKAAGLAGVVTTAAMSHDPLKAAAMGIGSAVANEIVMKRGSAFAARTANAVARTLQGAPQAFAKWMPALQKAAQGGTTSLSVAHHLLMRSDPDYYNLMTQGGMADDSTNTHPAAVGGQ